MDGHNTVWFAMRRCWCRGGCGLLLVLCLSRVAGPDVPAQADGGLDSAAAGDGGARFAMYLVLSCVPAAKSVIRDCIVY